MKRVTFVRQDNAITNEEAIETLVETIETLGGLIAALVNTGTIPECDGDILLMRLGYLHSGKANNENNS